MLPVSILRQMGADYVIGVDVFAHKVRRWLGPLGYLIGGFEITLERSGLGVVQADCGITPALAGKTYMRFSRRDELFELGRQAALAKLPVILRDLGMDEAAQVSQRLRQQTCCRAHESGLAHHAHPFAERHGRIFSI